MLSLILVIVLIIMIVSIVLLVQTEEGGWVAGVVFPAITAVGLVVAIVVGIAKISTGTKIDKQIEMCVEENANIEQQITITVERYLEHELNVYDTLQGESITTLLVVYPEINGNELVKRQMDIFVANNDKIRELKNEKLNLSTWKFLVYFGR